VPCRCAKTGLEVRGHAIGEIIQHSRAHHEGSRKIEVGGIEYIIDDSDGQLYFYSTTSTRFNFVAKDKVVG